MPEISARNVLKGKVKRVTHGKINSEIVIELPGGIELTSIITRLSAERLQLKEGKEVAAIIKSTNVMLATGF
ncbi:MAG: molybdopterin-binding protein [Candidatus Hermodarchaeota archaeon]